MLALILAFACGASPDGAEASCPRDVELEAPLLGDDGLVAPGPLADGARVMLWEGVAFFQLAAGGPPDDQGHDLRVELWLDGEHLLSATGSMSLGEDDTCSSAQWSTGASVVDPPGEGLSEQRELWVEAQVAGAQARAWTYDLTLVGGEEWARDSGGVDDGGRGR